MLSASRSGFGDVAIIASLVIVATALNCGCGSLPLGESRKGAKTRMQLFDKLTEHAEAVRIVLESTPRLPVERAALTDALGLVLAEDLLATVDPPPFDNSAADGYALRSADAAEAGRALTAVYEAPSGPSAPRWAGAGEAA